jgi:hypothetical protein
VDDITMMLDAPDTAEQEHADALAAIAALEPAHTVRKVAAQFIVNTEAQRRLESQIAADRYTTPEGRSLKIAELRANAPAVNAPTEAILQTALANIERLVLAVPPAFLPPSASHAAHINGVLADLADATPAVFHRLAAEAMARNDLALVQRLADRLESFVESRPVFKGSSAVLAQLRQSLRTPEVQRSDAAAEWLDRARSELVYLRRVLADPTNDVGLHIRTGALNTLFHATP